METLLLFIKSYRPDFERVKKLLRSLEKHNVDNLPVWMSVNDDDYAFFKSRIPAAVQLCKDSAIVTSNIQDGWQYQQVIKSQVHRLEICENYVCIDSDGEFIRDFSRADFMYDARTPYTVRHESKSLRDLLLVLGLSEADAYRRRATESIRNCFGTHGKDWDYGPSPYIWSTKVWRHFNDEYLRPRNHTFESFFLELEKTALPSEAVIYGEYLLLTRLIEIVPIDELFKVYHYRRQFEFEREHFDVERLSKNYLGVIFQSNWHGPKQRRFWFFGR